VDVVHVRLSVSKPSTLAQRAPVTVRHRLHRERCNNAWIKAVLLLSRKASLPRWRIPTRSRCPGDQAGARGMDEPRWLRNTSYKRPVEEQRHAIPSEETSTSAGEDVQERDGRGARVRWTPLEDGPGGAPNRPKLTKRSHVDDARFETSMEVDGKRSSKKKKGKRPRPVEAADEPPTSRNRVQRIHGKHLAEGGAVEQVLRRELDRIEVNLESEIGADVLKRWLALETGIAAEQEHATAAPWEKNLRTTKQDASNSGQQRKELKRRLSEALETNAKDDWMAALRMASIPNIATDRERSMIFQAMQRRGFRSNVDLFEAALQEWRPTNAEELLQQVEGDSSMLA